jgi:hypothetical protein
MRKSPVRVLGFLLSALLLFGCTQLKPLQLPAETSSPAAEGPFWQDLKAVRNDEWFYLLSSSEEAINWRL